MHDLQNQVDNDELKEQLEKVTTEKNEAIEKVNGLSKNLDALRLEVTQMKEAVEMASSDSTVPKEERAEKFVQLSKKVQNLQNLVQEKDH